MTRYSGRTPRWDFKLIGICFLAAQPRWWGFFCAEQIFATYLTGRSRLLQCSYHRQVWVDSDTGRLLTGDCLRGRPYQPRVLTVYPAELLAWWRAENQAVPDIPGLSRDCVGIPSQERPRIVSPKLETPYLIRPDAPNEYQKIPLIAQVGPHSEKLFWYQDGFLLGAPEANEPFLVPLRPGRHRLVVVDNLGLSDSITYRVSAPQVP